MHERMLDPSHKPDLNEMAGYCEDAGTIFLSLNETLSSKYGTRQDIRFPYGNQYGWGVKHALGKNHICYLFAEKGAFTLIIRLSNAQIERVYPEADERVKELLVHKYPCGDGGWIHFRAITPEDERQACKLLQAKMKK